MRRLVDATKWVSSHQSITGFATLVGTVIGIIAALRSQDTWIQVSGLFLAIFAGLILLSVCFPYIVMISRWLTWKFSLGLVIGAVAIAFLFPVVAPVVDQMISQPGEIEVTHTVPTSNSTLKRASDSFDVFFSTAIKGRDKRKVFVSIEPKYPVKWFWIIDILDEIHELNIEPTRYFPNEAVPRFEYGKKYTVEITGSPLKEKVVVVFHTPKKQED
ncbi:MAG: hypothetical protein KUF77_12880 [Candidatus Thiodiazotropha sp. (ex Lucina aurantia)]|nr:hypothetical protein [Candidatus Thiodiazotropha taylori]MBV2098773.1 hypothetical protein [Candidatus Thiodiazotropha sp. (ex Codakia orbicularis)]MBV2103911.1 hypothetical protein [Candidatus Thiodiazotropha sp. (ex Lucina aurantia)]MBV2118218.1 hypothetical protein [Candidatus Thiodiazotropha sp. (ex Lucina aurantia)]MBV2126809.1 hypothetical protein [Candidatus Thiodiazotropha taylori]